MKCIKAGLVFDAVHSEPEVKDILISDGKIIKIGKDLECSPETEMIDAKGMHVYPGFVEAHCHLGMAESGIGFEGDDTNESTDILTPQLRGLDGINPIDPTFEEARKAGVTSVCTGPGSANVVGGTFVAIKTYGSCVDDMIIKEDVAMKCAFGENPKRCYREKNNCSRMATASKLREILFKTNEYKVKLTEAQDDPSKRPAFDMKLNAMLPVVNRRIPLKAHAHRADDIFTALRIAKEFDVKITLEHVTEGHLIVDKLKNTDAMLAVGPSLTHATKFELKNKTFETPGVLAKAGCHVSIITDSPVIPLQYLPLCASLAIKSGMEEFAALQAITINAAEHIGIEKRVGSLEEGKDADIVIMNGSCFDVASEVIHTLIDGEIRA